MWVRSSSVYILVVFLVASLQRTCNPSSGVSVSFFAEAVRRTEVDVDDVGDDYEDDEEDDDYDDYDDYDEEDDEEIFETFSSPSRRAEYEKWFNTEHTTLIWQLIDAGDLTSLQQLFETDPDLAYIRSEDGRGPLFWAYEYERWDVVQFLLDSGADASAVDANGNTPVSLMGKDQRPPPSEEEEEDEEDGDWEYEEEDEDDVEE